MKRVLLSGLDGSNLEGEVIGGESYDPDTGQCDLEDTFTVRRDDGNLFEVHGWLLDITLVAEKHRLVMQA